MWILCSTVDVWLWEGTFVAKSQIYASVGQDRLLRMVNSQNWLILLIKLSTLQDHREIFFFSPDTKYVVSLQNTHQFSDSLTPTGCTTFNSILALNTWSYYQTPKVKGSVLQDYSHFRHEQQGVTQATHTSWLATNSRIPTITLSGSIIHLNYS